MKCILIELALYAVGAGFVPLSLLQFLPARYTVTKGTLAYLETRRHNYPGLSVHMLSRFGKGLRLASYGLWVLAAILLVVAFVFCED